MTLGLLLATSCVKKDDFEQLQQDVVQNREIINFVNNRAIDLENALEDTRLELLAVIEAGDSALAASLEEAISILEMAIADEAVLRANGDATNAASIDALTIALEEERLARIEGDTRLSNLLAQAIAAIDAAVLAESAARAAGDAELAEALRLAQAELSGQIIRGDDVAIATATVRLNTAVGTINESLDAINGRIDLLILDIEGKLADIKVINDRQANHIGSLITKVKKLNRLTRSHAVHVANLLRWVSALQGNIISLRTAITDGDSAAVETAVQQSIELANDYTDGEIENLDETIGEEVAQLLMDNLMAANAYADTLTYDDAELSNAIQSLRDRIALLSDNVVIASVTGHSFEDARTGDNFNGFRVNIVFDVIEGAEITNIGDLRSFSSSTIDNDNEYVFQWDGSATTVTVAATYEGAIFEYTVNVPQADGYVVDEFVAPANSYVYESNGMETAGLTTNGNGFRFPEQSTDITDRFTVGDQVRFITESFDFTTTLRKKGNVGNGTFNLVFDINDGEGLLNSEVIDELRNAFVGYILL